MPFFIDMALRARAELEAIGLSPTHVKRLKAVRKALALLENNPRHPSLNRHKYSSMTAETGEEVFEDSGSHYTSGSPMVRQGG